MKLWGSDLRIQNMNDVLAEARMRRFVYLMETLPIHFGSIISGCL